MSIVCVLTPEIKPVKPGFSTAHKPGFTGLKTGGFTRGFSGTRVAFPNRTCTTKYNRLVHKFRQTRDRRGYVLERRFTQVSEITQCNGHYAVEGHSRSPILVPIVRLPISD